MVACLRPQVARIGDGLLPLLSFAPPFYAMGVLRWHVYAGMGLPVVLVKLTAAIFAVSLLGMWGPLRMASFYLAVSAVVDFFAIALMQGGVPAEALRRPWTQIVEVLMVAHVYLVWKKLPKVS